MTSSGNHSSCNIAAALPRLARERPDQVAMRCPGRDGRYAVALTYAQLDARSDAIAAGLAARGIERGMRCVVMLRPTPEFFLVMYALFKRGAVPVLVDPGIDKRALRTCLDEAQAQAFIGIPLAHAARVALGWARSARIRITTGARPLLADATLAQVERAGAHAVPPTFDTGADDTAAILFTSGSTGVPKGVVYRHRHFAAQVDMLRAAFDLQPGGVDQLFGSPALIAVLARHGAPLPSLRRVTSAGAPVPADVVARMRALLPDDACFWTPYGATECLPVSVIEGRELQATRERSENGAGTCVGRPVPPNTVRIIAIDDAAIPEWDAAREVRPGQVGEITVAGPTVTDAYFNRDAATRLAKIHERLADGDTRVVHRMGDLGYLDGDGRLWFCGRKSQRVIVDAQTTLCTDQVEPVFNTHPDVRRSALVGVGPVGAQRPVLCVELRPGIARAEQARIADELRHLGDGFVHTACVDTVLFHQRFPVDIRHNAKIGREQLGKWATRQLRKRPQ